ncbi:hypothetical protein [uncultured Porphyromonas sp.]|uniref:hypothetical protein n=1 Tax=uncultured Porphyromonas sp. TaxID=159274 RepID=UPI0025924E6D|nr:hypothetical protein [uncultured Porphyromonas sp.]
MRPNSYSHIAIFLLLALSVACCNKEHMMVEIAPEINLFAPDDTDHSPEATLRRSFYEQTGAYLLFNDTLKREDRSRVLSIPYNVTITGSDYYEAQLYRLKYLTTIGQRTEAANFIQNNVAKYVSKKAMPYSVLLVDTIIAYPYDRVLKTYNMEKPNRKQVAVFGMQTLAIAHLIDIGTKNQEEQQKLARTILNNMVNEMMSHTPEESLTPFYAISAAYYDKSFSKEEGNLPNVKDMRELGFIKCYRFKPDYMSFYPAERDLKTFLKVLLDMPEAEWRSKNKEFPLVIQKFELLNQIIEKRGISLAYLNM